MAAEDANIAGKNLLLLSQPPPPSPSKRFGYVAFADSFPNETITNDDLKTTLREFGTPSVYFVHIPSNSSKVFIATVTAGSRKPCRIFPNPAEFLKSVLNVSQGLDR